MLGFSLRKFLRHVRAIFDKKFHVLCDIFSYCETFFHTTAGPYPLVLLFLCHPPISAGPDARTQKVPPRVIRFRLLCCMSTLQSVRVKHVKAAF